MAMTRRSCRRPVFRLAIALAIIASLAPLSTTAENHEATRTTVTWTTTDIGVVDPGEEWVDDAGIYHARGITELDDITGDIAGTGVSVLNIDFFAPGECTEESCPGYTEVWGTVEIEDEAGRWSGRFVHSRSDVPGEEYAFSRITLHGRGGNAGMSFFGEVVDADPADSAVTFAATTFEGTLSTMANPIEALNVHVSVCFTDDAIVGNYLGTGAVEGFGHAEAAFLSSGGPWTHTYNLFGFVELSDEAGSLTVGVVSGGQDNGSVSFAFGNFVITGGTGAYEQLYGHGRIIGAATPMPQCESGVGASLSLIGEAHYN